MFTIRTETIWDSCQTEKPRLSGTENSDFTRPQCQNARWADLVGLWSDSKSGYSETESTDPDLWECKTMPTWLTLCDIFQAADMKATLKREGANLKVPQLQFEVRLPGFSIRYILILA